jgi:sugar transferase (PEP-CTERM/EpsH1 system associated)
VRIHGEHGRDVGDFDGSNRKYQLVRRAYSPFVSRYIALSRDLESYLTERVGIAGSRVSQLYNGVDADKFRPAQARAAIPGCPFQDPELVLVGTVGRMQVVKDQLTLARAFVQALAIEPLLRARLRLVMVGDGPLRNEVRALIEKAGMADLAWLPGERDDVADVLRGLDVFVLPSLGEGISNTILEAMASGLPVIATRVGGNAELVAADETGFLVPADDPAAMAQRIVDYAGNIDLAREHGRAGRKAIESRFSISSMVRGYQDLYDQMLGRGRST